jgi:electron transfer flavoprotein beta subunit
VKILLIVSAIDDPKWRFGTGAPRIFSPFDQSAVEVSLKLRDRDPATQINIVVVGAVRDDALARSLLAFRPNRIWRAQDTEDAAPWDIAAQARRFHLLIGTLFKDEGLPDHLVLGRQFGDYDDGAFPSLLAGLFNRDVIGLIQGLEAREGRLFALREKPGLEQRITINEPSVMSVTNDRSNRLRHPLMKNVMNSKRETLPTVSLELTPAASIAGPFAASLSLLECAAPPRIARATACRMLSGSADQQAEEIVQYLMPWRLAE